MLVDMWSKFDLTWIQKEPIQSSTSHQISFHFVSPCTVDAKRIPNAKLMWRSLEMMSFNTTAGYLWRFRWWWFSFKANLLCYLVLKGDMCSIYPLPRMPVTTRIIVILIRDPKLNLHFATVTGRGPHQIYVYIYIYVFSTVVDGCSCFFYTWRKNKFFEAPKTLPLKLTTSLPLKICKRAPKRKWIIFQPLEFSGELVALVAGRVQ